MPRGVYVRKSKSAPKKRAVKRAPTTTRRSRRKVVVDNIPTIPRSALRSSVSAARTPDAPGTVRTTIVPVTAEPVVETNTQLTNDEVKFAVFDNDGEDNIDWNDMSESFNDYDAAERHARETCEEDGSTSVFIVQIVGIVERKGVIVRRTGPRL